MSWKEEVESAIADAKRDGYSDGYLAGLASQMENLSFKEGDVVVIKGEGLSREYLDRLRTRLMPLGVKGLISVTEYVEIGKLSDINLSLLGLERKKSTPTVCPDCNCGKAEGCR